MLIEKDRIKLFLQGELPNTGYLIFKVTTFQPKEKLLKVKEVISKISEFDSENWPSDRFWENALPNWFVNKIKENSIEDILSSKYELWEFVSWLDAMKFRGWEWYSSNYASDFFEIVIEPFSFPFSINPLKFVIYSTGIEYQNIILTDCATK